MLSYDEVRHDCKAQQRAYEIFCVVRNTLEDTEWLPHSDNMVARRWPHREELRRSFGTNSKKQTEYIISKTSPLAQIWLI